MQDCEACDGVLTTNTNTTNTATRIGSLRPKLLLTLLTESNRWTAFDYFKAKFRVRLPAGDQVAALAMNAARQRPYRDTGSPYSPVNGSAAKHRHSLSGSRIGTNALHPLF